jgi:hypothetical protein
VGQLTLRLAHLPKHFYEPHGVVGDDEVVHAVLHTDFSGVCMDKVSNERLTPIIAVDVYTSFLAEGLRSDRFVLSAQPEVSTAAKSSGVSLKGGVLSFD